MIHLELYRIGRKNMECLTIVPAFPTWCRVFRWQSCILNLKDLCIEGRLAPELGTLVHIKPIIMSNNFFTRIIPKEIGELKQLQVLDLGYNNFSGSLPHKLDINLSLTIICYGIHSSCSIFCGYLGMGYGL